MLTLRDTQTRQPSWYATAVVIYLKAWDLRSTYQLCSGATPAASPLLNIIHSVDIWFWWCGSPECFSGKCLGQWYSAVLVLTFSSFLPGLLVNLISHAKKWLYRNSEISSGKEIDLELECLSVRRLDFQSGLALTERVSLCELNEPVSLWEWPEWEESGKRSQDGFLSWAARARGNHLV